MPSKIRPRQLVSVVVTLGLVLALTSCGQDYPNSTFNHTTELNREIDHLWDRLLLWGTIVFVIVEVFVVLTVIRFRRRPNTPDPLQVHGNTAMEMVWTVTPALILVFIAVPTVRAIFRTQARPPADALQVQVIGHQWWWEFRYPQYNVTTANELFLPVGRTVDFELTTGDVVHSFWIPQLGGKRDLVSRHTNHMWFTPDTTLGERVFNGACVEFCGPSHANMRFRAFLVRPPEFARWAAQESAAAAFGVVPPPAAPAPADSGVRVRPAAAVTPQATPTAPVTPQATADSSFTFPADRVPAYAIPGTPVPSGVTFPDGLTGDPQRGMTTYSRSVCIGCHVIKGNPASLGVIGPNLTHIGSRTTIAAGLYPNDDRHLALWIKNARALKPGILMPTLGVGQVDPMTKLAASKNTGALTDQEIADIVAYLRALK